MLRRPLPASAHVRLRSRAPVLHVGARVQSRRAPRLVQRRARVHGRGSHVLFPLALPRPQSRQLPLNPRNRRSLARPPAQPAVVVFRLPVTAPIRPL
eukprot:1529129-Rhodomonas_salina.1